MKDSLSVVGNPFALDKTGDIVRPYIVAGSISKISDGAHQGATQADWITSNEDVKTMKNTFKMTMIIGPQILSVWWGRLLDREIVHCLVSSL